MLTKALDLSAKRKQPVKLPLEPGGAVDRNVQITPQAAAHHRRPGHFAEGNRLDARRPVAPGISHGVQRWICVDGP